MSWEIRLSRRPTQLTTSYDVKMQVIHWLTPILPVVDDDSESWVSKSSITSYFLSHEHEMSQQLNHEFITSVNNTDKMGVNRYRWDSRNWGNRQTNKINQANEPQGHDSELEACKAITSQVPRDGLRDEITCSSSGWDFDNWGIAFLGMTKKCTGAVGLMSSNATHCRKSVTDTQIWLSQ